MRLPEVRGELLVVVAELGEHVHRRDKIGIVVEHALQAADVTNRPHGGATDLANAFCDRVGGGKNLDGLFIQQEMIVAKVRAGDMPVKILRLQVKSKHIREQDIEGSRNILDSVWFEVRRSLKRGGPQRFGI